jgi:hypothetical protein
VLVNCSRSEAPPHPDRAQRSPASKAEERAANLSELELAASAANARRAALAAPIASAVVEIRERALSLAAPPLLPRHLAFGKGFLVQARANETVLRNSTTGEELSRLPLNGPRAVVGVAAGSTLVAALEGSFRFDPGQVRPHKLPRLSLLPGFVIEPRRDRLDVISVLQAPTRTLQRYALKADAPIGLESERQLEDYDGGAFASLSGGNLLYTSRSGTALVQDPGFGKAKPLPLPENFGSVWRLAPAEQINRAWVVTASGELTLVELGARLVILRNIRTGLLPFDFAASKRFLALVSVTEHAAEPRRFTLTVYDRTGSQFYSHALGDAPVTAQPDWVEHASANRELVLGDTPPRVAVGGASTVRVFELASGKELFER